MEGQTDPDDSSEDDEPELTQTQGKGKARSTSNSTSKSKKQPRKIQHIPLHTQAQLEKLNTDTAQISVHNYQVMSATWTDRYIDQLLAHRKEIVNTRPPSNVFAEAESHQAQYRRTKKLLCLIGHCSPMAMDSAL